MNNTNRFNNYQLLDFVLDDDFRAWILVPDADSDLFWISWINNNPDKERMIQNAKEIILSFKVNDAQISDREIKSIIDETVKKISNGINEPIAETKNSYHKYYWLSGIAACLIICFIVLFPKFSNSQQSIYQQLVVNATVHLTEQYNNTGKPFTVKLDDGSVIVLQNKSRLSFPKTFIGKKTRSVYLNGDASFSIAKNPLKPFLVYANGIVTKVLGTKFIIHSFDTDKKAVVEVISGIVSVNSFKLKNAKPDSSNNANGVMLTRNQKVTYSTDNQELQASLMENPRVINDSANLQYQFLNTNVKEVFTSLRKLYGIDFVYDEKALNNKMVTADLSNTTMYQKLDVICRILDCHYEIIDRKIFINPQH